MKIRTTTGAIAAIGVLGLGAGIAAPAEAAPIVTKAYTKAQVAKHKTASNCWTIVGKNVYNLTRYIYLHPNGSADILGMCGKNATAAYRAEHGTGGRAGAELAAYKIGTLK